MGKATIIENKEEGLYSVSIDRDTTLLDGLLDKITVRLAEIADQIIEVENQKSAKEAEKTANDALLNIQINLLTPENSKISNEIMRLLQIGLDLTSEIRDLNGKLKLLEIQEMSLNKRQELLENSKNEAEDDIRDVWCADYSLELTGEVAACEVNGEPTNIILYPGSIEEDQPIIPTATGILTPIIGQSVAQTSFNFSIFPGWQKWKPIFRIGEITDIDYDADTCTVTLDSADSHYQGLNINQAQSLESVPIVYMSCNSLAFEIGNRVLVQFQSQDFNNPRVIGFESAPIDCCWIEPWEGPLFTTLWPWVHHYGGVNNTPGTPIFSDNSTTTITDGVLYLTVGNTPTGGGWIEQWHQWYYYPASPIKTKANRIYFDADARQWCGFPDKNLGQCFLAINGTKDGTTVYFQVYVYNSSYLWGSKIPIGCTNPSGWPTDAETEWEEVSSNTWAKNLLHDTKTLIDLPIEDVQINYVLLDIKSWVESVPPVPSYLTGFQMSVNEIRIC
jgi:hypothetical protein